MLRVCILVVMTLAVAPASAAEAPPTPAPLDGKAYTETIPKSTVSIDMVPIPAGEIKLPTAAAPTQIKAIYMSKCEIPWDAYNIFCFQLDLTDKEKAEGVDAKSRPSR